MSKLAETTMDEIAGQVKLMKADMGPDMDERYVDKALYYMILDAIGARRPTSN